MRSFLAGRINDPVAHGKVYLRNNLYVYSTVFFFFFLTSFALNESSLYYTANMRSENASSGRLREVKNNGTELTVRHRKWSRSLTGGGRLLGVPTVRL